MPQAIKQHRPPRPLRDDRRRQQDRARHQGRALPYNGKQWQAIRSAVLGREPLCRTHDCNALAREVDHIDGDDSNNAPDNLQPLCKSCHSSKTRREMNEKSLGRERKDTAPSASRTQPRFGAL